RPVSPGPFPARPVRFRDDLARRGRAGIPQDGARRGAPFRRGSVDAAPNGHHAIRPNTMRRMSDNAEWGPLAALIGEWEGDQGLDFAYANAEGKVKDTPYREKTSMKPFGPVENGSQVLFGLDYRMVAWRGAEDDPVHTEAGCWRWG